MKGTKKDPKNFTLKESIFAAIVTKELLNKLENYGKENSTFNRTNETS